LSVKKTKCKGGGKGILGQKVLEGSLIHGHF
jgi:hypothetical protein